MGDLSDKEFILTSAAFQSLAKEMSQDDREELLMRQNCRFSREEGEFVVVSMIGNELLSTSFVRLHTNPLRIEHWAVDGDKRMSGSFMATTLQAMVDKIIAGVESGWFW